MPIRAHDRFSEEQRERGRRYGLEHDEYAEFVHEIELPIASQTRPSASPVFRRTRRLRARCRRGRAGADVEVPHDCGAVAAKAALELYDKLGRASRSPQPSARPPPTSWRSGEPPSGGSRSLPRRSERHGGARYVPPNNARIGQDYGLAA
jgi:hypothetical protein